MFANMPEYSCRFWQFLDVRMRTTLESRNPTVHIAIDDEILGTASHKPHRRNKANARFDDRELPGISRRQSQKTPL